MFRLLKESYLLNKQRFLRKLSIRMRKQVVIILLLLTSIGCGKENRPDIPYVYVDRILYPNSLDYISVGGYKYLNAGHRGILIYRLLSDQFLVFERCCPYDPEVSTAHISVDPSGLTCTDSTCLSKFVITDGSPISGPSPFSLVQYRYSYDGEALHIYN